MKVDIDLMRIVMLYMRTTLNISDGLLQELREQARSEQIPMNQLVEITLRRGLATGSSVDPAHKPQIHTYEVGVKPAYQGMSMNQRYDQLESEATLMTAEE